MHLVGAGKVAEVPVNELAADLGLRDVDEILGVFVSADLSNIKCR